MLPKSRVLYVFMVFFVLTDAFFARFDRIRKRKSFVPAKNNTIQEQTVGVDDLTMYFTRRTTPWPRMRVTVHPSIEMYYNKKIMKDKRIKQAYLKKAKMKKKEELRLRRSTFTPHVAPV